MLRVLAWSLLICSATIEAQDFSIPHKSCKIRASVTDQSKHPDLFKYLEKQLKLKKYQLVINSTIVKKGDLILTLKKQITQRIIFPPCKITITIKDQGGIKNFFSGQTQRAFPRNLSKNLLCKLAIRDVLYHLPYCSKQP